MDGGQQRITSACRPVDPRSAETMWQTVGSWACVGALGMQPGDVGTEVTDSGLRVAAAAQHFRPHQMRTVPTLHGSTSTSRATQDEGDSGRSPIGC